MHVHVHLQWTLVIIIVCMGESTYAMHSVYDSYYKVCKHSTKINSKVFRRVRLFPFRVIPCLPECFMCYCCVLIQCTWHSVLVYMALCCVHCGTVYQCSNKFITTNQLGLLL